MNKAIVEELQQDGRRTYGVDRRGGRSVRGRGAPAGPEAARARGHPDRRRHRSAAGRLPEPGDGRHPGGRRRPGGRRAARRRRRRSTTWSCAPARSTSSSSWCARTRTRLLELLNGVIRTTPGCARDRDVHVPQADEADLHVGDPMSDHDHDELQETCAPPPVDALHPDVATTSRDDPGDRPRRRRLGLRPARQALPRRALRAVHQPDRPRSHASWPKPQPGRPRELAYFPVWSYAHPAAASSWPSACRAHPGRLQPDLLHHRRLRGGRVGLEARPSVLPADRPTGAASR